MQAKLTEAQANVAEAYRLWTENIEKARATLEGDSQGALYREALIQLQLLGREKDKLQKQKDELTEVADGTFETGIALSRLAFFHGYPHLAWDPVYTLIKGGELASHPKDKEWWKGSLRRNQKVARDLVVPPLRKHRMFGDSESCPLLYLDLYLV